MVAAQPDRRGLFMRRLRVITRLARPDNPTTWRAPRRALVPLNRRGGPATRAMWPGGPVMPAMRPDDPVMPGGGLATRAMRRGGLATRGMRRDGPAFRAMQPDSLEIGPTPPRIGRIERLPAVELQTGAEPDGRCICSPPPTVGTPVAGMAS